MTKPRRAVQTRRPSSRIRWSRALWIGTAALLIGAGAGGYLVMRANQSPGLTPLVDGRVTPSLFHDGHTAPPPSLPKGFGPPPGMLPRRGSAPSAATPRVPVVPRGGVSTARPSLPQGATLAVVDLNSAALDQLQTLPGITREYATRIVAGRPYRVFNDVVTRAGIPAAIVDQLSPPATIRSVEHATSTTDPGRPAKSGRAERIP